MEFIYSLIPVEVFWSILLIIHGLLSVALIGAISHQASALLKNHRITGTGIVNRFGSVQSSLYTSAICVLWTLSFLFGGLIYAKYRIAIRIPMEQEGLWLTQGFFELKEHLITIGFLLLPGYYALWNYDSLQEHQTAKKCVTITLAVVCWYSFIVGHILNNVRGFGS
jgi:hypothetical protein